MLRDGVAIPIAIRVFNSDQATIAFESQVQLSLRNLSINDEQLVGETVGQFVISHPYQDESKIYVRLRRDGDRLVGRLTALQPAYFALSHWTELKRDN